MTTADTGLEILAEGEPVAAPVRARRHTDHWVWQVTALSFLLGILLALAIATAGRARRAGMQGPRFGISAAVLSTYKETNAELQREILDLRRQVQELEASARDGTTSSRVLQEQLAALRAVAGLAAVQGPGLKITLRDSREPAPPNLSPEDYDSFRIHDQDVNGLLNELKAAGAEALAISGRDDTNIQRVVVTTSARCVGPIVIVNGVQLAAPFTIYAIGQPKTLRDALEMVGGFIQTRGLDVLKMITIEESDHLVLPEYSGSIRPQHARPATP